jgi:protein associated with RNAse G/E
MTELGRDGFGVWLGAPVGTVVQRGDEPEKTHPHGFVKLVPPGRWWTAIWNAGNAGRFEIYVDVATPAIWDGGGVYMVDLDLDVVRYRDGGVAVLDEDEFEDHRRRFHYPESVVDAARAAAARLVVDLGERREPFGEVGPAWLQRYHETAGIPGSTGRFP